MKTFTFKGGIHPPYCKEMSLGEPLRRAPLPDVVTVPLSQHIGAPNEPLVKKGDVVEEGQVIGKSDSFISSPAHAPVSGTVRSVEKAFHPTLGPVMSVIIERDKTKEPKKYFEQDCSALSAEDIIEKVRKAGVVGLGGAAFPTHVKLSVPKDRKIEDLVVNGAECEPFLTCDHVLMSRHAKEVLQGIELIARVLHPSRIHIAVENNKKAAIFAFEKLIKRSTNPMVAGIRIAVLKTKYPQGGEKQLVKAILKKEVPPGKLPLDVGALVQNVGTVFAIYEAVCLGKPLIERVITVSGDCLSRPGNYCVRIGTSIKDIAEKYGVELFRSPNKIITGGPMTGFAQPDMESPVIKGTSGVLFLSEYYAKEFEEERCVRCAKCVDVCPMHLLPTEIKKDVDRENWPLVEKLNADDCMECGACAYICPSRIPLVHYIKRGKDALRQVRAKAARAREKS